MGFNDKLKNNKICHLKLWNLYAKKVSSSFIYFSSTLKNLTNFTQQKVD